MSNNYTTSTDSGCITTGSTGDNWTYGTGNVYTEPVVSIPSIVIPNIELSKKKGDDDMRYLYEVILVNPKNDEFVMDKYVAKTETSALMKAYDEYANFFKKVDFDDLKTSCRILMEWKKEKSLKKAIETIKEAVE